MPDERKHRGPHERDRQLFAADQVPRLQAAAADLSWLLERGYATPSSLKLVGDRYDLLARQRLAVGRCACAREMAEGRAGRMLGWEQLAGETLWIDGYNVLTSLEAALGGGVILHAGDGTFRDMASMHGSYRKVAETEPAIEILGQFLAQTRIAGCRWLLDQPVSNSGRLKAMLLEWAGKREWPWEVDLVPDPDPILKACEPVVATVDSEILNHAPRVFNLARRAIEQYVRNAWIVDLSGGAG